MFQVTKILPFETSQREMKDAARLAMQSAVAAAATYLAMQVIGMPEKFVGILSAVLVIQPSVGNTMGEAWDRVAATLIGSAIGAACLLLLSGAYATAGALALSMLVINAVAGFRPEWRYGAVAAVALSLGAESDLWQTTQDRALAIGLGALIGIVVFVGRLAGLGNRSGKAASSRSMAGHR